MKGFKGRYDALKCVANRSRSENASLHLKTTSTFLFTVKKNIHYLDNQSWGFVVVVVLSFAASWLYLMN